MWRSGVLVLLCLLISSPVVGQESQWHFEARCAPQVLADAWAYDGTILMTGYAGLHGVNAAWDTPRVLAPVGRHPQGKLSPDNAWFATLQEYTIYSETYNHLHVIEGLRVFSTGDNGLVYTIPWQNTWLQMWGRREFFWLDNAHILYEYSEDFVHDLDEAVILNPFDGSLTPFASPMDLLDGGSGFYREYVQYPSPDFTRTIYRVSMPDTTAKAWALYDIATGGIVANIESQDSAVFAWRSDSAVFAGHITTEEEQSRLLLFNNEGDSIDTIIKFDSGRVDSPHNLQWSPEGRYLGYARNTLLVIDTESRVVYDTCLSPATGMAWSPDGNQFAFLEPGSGLQDVYVFDLPSWSYRIVARHIVEMPSWHTIMGWRADR